MPTLPAVELDDAQLSRLPAGASPLRWENVEQAPQWVSGAKPTFDFQSRLHIVTLRPGKETKFRVPPRGHVRVVRLDQPLALQNIEILFSNGSGLYHPAALAWDECGKSLIAAADEREVSLARVVAPLNAPRSMRLAIFASRHLPLDFVAGYHFPICQVGEPIRVSDDKSGPRSSRQFWNVQPGLPGQCEVTGPARLRIESRFIYDTADRDSLQTYRIHVGLNDTLHRILELETTAEARRHVHVGPKRERREYTTGRRQFGYVDVPEGVHQLTLDTTANILCRVESTQSKVRSTGFSQNLPSPFRLKAGLQTTAELQALHPINALRDLPRQPRDFLNAENAVSIWDLSTANIEHHLIGAPDTPAGQLRIAQRSARDNRFRDGGLRAAMLMRAAAAGRPDKPEIRTAAYDLKVFHTFYRSLLPVNARTPVEPVLGRFHVRSLRRPTDDTIDRVVGEQLIEGIAKRAALGRFVDVGGGEKNAREYRMPATNSPSLLRIAVDKCSLSRVSQHASQANAQLWLELDGCRYRLDVMREPELPVGEFVPSAVETALSAARWKHGCYDAGNLGGPLSHQTTPAPFVETANCEIFIPQGTRTVRLWSELDGITAPRVALFYRASRPYQLNEANYHEMLRRTGVPADQLFSALVADESCSSVPFVADPYAFRELQNHWVPLARLLHSHRRSLTDSLQPRNSTEPPPPAAALMESHRRGAEAFAAGQWASAVEAWSDFQSAAPSEYRKSALLGRVMALQNMGDDFLANQELRGLCLLDEDSQVRAAAQELLNRTFAQTDDWKNTERWAALNALNEPSPDNILRLASALLHNERYDFALQVLLCVPQPMRPVDATLLSSYQAGWWRTFKAAAQCLPPEEQAFWSAQRELRWGNYAVAKQRLMLAGNKGAAWHQHLNHGEEILSRLTQGHEAERQAAVNAWEAWQSSHPGPLIWQEEGSLVGSCAGTASLRSDRELYGQYYLAEPGIPLVLPVQGTVLLKLEMRPLHQTTIPRAEAPGVSSPSPDPSLDDRVSIRQSGQPTRTISVVGNRTSDGLTVVADATRRPGRDVPVFIQVAAGSQTVEIESDEHPMAIRVFAQRPAYPLPVLPILSRETVDAVFAGTFGRARVTPFEWKSPRSLAHRNLVAHVIPSDCRKPTSNIPFVVSSTGFSRKAEWQTRKADGAVATGNVLGRTARQHTAHISFEQPVGQGAPTANDPETQMRELLAIAQSDPHRYLESAVRANALVAAHPNAPRLGSLQSRILQLGRWTTRNEFDASAGIILKPIEGWSPESPEMRVRRAMMNGRRKADAVLNGPRHLVFTLQNETDTQFEIELWRPRIGYLQTTSIPVQMKIDDGPAETIELSGPHSTAARTVPISRGEHRIELWLSNPLANHLVLMNIREAATIEADQTGEGIGHSTRKYWVATRAEPLQFTVQSPAWLRIDERVGDQTMTRYELVVSGTKRLELTPTAGSHHAMFRVFAYEFDATAKPPKSLKVPRINWPVPPPMLDVAGGVTGLLTDGNGQRLNCGVPWGDQLSLWSLGGVGGNCQLGRYQPTDAFPLGHEDGTLRFQLGVNSRRALDEGDNRAIETDDFVESSMTHFLHDYWVDRYCETKALIRVRDEGGPTVGFTHSGRWDAPGFWTPLPNFTTRNTRDPSFRVNAFNFRWNAFGYLQSPNTAEAGFRNETEWSFGGTASVSRRYDITSCIYRLSTIDVFARALSLDDVQYAPGTVDQDIFTQFKSDHRHGIAWSQRFVWNTRVDRQWWLRFGSRSNEDFAIFRPDRIGVEVGQWGQSGWLQWGWSYRANEFQQDDDRRRDFLQETLNLDLRWEHWRHSGRRFEVLANYRHDLTQERHAFSINFATYLSRGRGYWDHSPRTLRFGDVRKQLAIPRWLAR